MFNLFLRSNKEAPASTTEHAVESRDDQDSMMTTAPKLQDQPFHQSPHQKANVTSDMHTMTTAATTSSSSEEVNQITAGETSNKAAATESVIEVKQPRIKTPVKIDDNMKGGGQTPDFKTKKGKGKNVSRKKIDLTKAAKKSESSEEKMKSHPEISAESSGAQASAVDVHNSCKKTISSLHGEVEYWKSTVLNISRETQAMNNLSADLKLAAIKGICDEAEKNEAKFPNVRSQKPFKGRRGPRQPQKQDSASATTSIQISNNNQPLNQLHRQYPRRMQPMQAQHFSHPASHQPHQPINRVFNSVFSVQQQQQQQQPQPPQPHDPVNRIRGGPQRVISQWNPRPTAHMINNIFKQNSDVQDMTQSRHRFNLNHYNSIIPDVAMVHSFHQVHPHLPSNNVPQPHMNANNFPLLSSTAESDHPVCVRMREELRNADDAESLIKLIKKAEAHKIHDLVDRGRRKLDKLHLKLGE